jgi:hypothetical protein
MAPTVDGSLQHSQPGLNKSLMAGKKRGETDEIGRASFF